MTTTRKRKSPKGKGKRRQPGFALQGAALMGTLGLRGAGALGWLGLRGASLLSGMIGRHPSVAGGSTAFVVVFSFIAANALWPRTTIATAAVRNLLGGDFLVQRSRTADIVADAACCILQKPSFETTGHFFIDEDVLRKEGISDFGKYAVNPDNKLMMDLFL